MKLRKILWALAVVAAPAFSAESHIVGTVTSITSVGRGLLMRVNGDERPTGCPGTSAWMLIPEENKTMISVALAAYMSGNKSAVVYVDVNATGYCKIIQYDPQF